MCVEYFQLEKEHQLVKSPQNDDDDDDDDERHERKNTQKR